jgi:hypothetical protein
LGLVVAAACGNGEVEKLRIKPKNAPSDAARTLPATPDLDVTVGPGARITARPPNGVPLEQCPPLAVSLTEAGAWVGTARHRTFAAACNGAPDVPAVGLELCAHARSERCSAIEIAIGDGIPYDKVVAVMDAAVAAGFKDVGLVKPSELSVSFPDQAEAGEVLEPGCGKTLAACGRQR